MSQAHHLRRDSFSGAAPMDIAGGFALTCRLRRHIGLISYGAYLYHVMTLQGLLSILHLPIEAPHLVAVAAEFVLTIVVATASYRLMEQPIRNLARRRRKGQAKAAAETAPEVS